ncbi:carbonic anhydrase [Rhizobium sp. RAF56]|uniref:carbonic anhydrase n=1 Tax=Rhizobium sp. RAF56 TaxID=3233062 RepID=UPI003F9D06BA
MASKLPEDVSPEDPTWLAEVTYRFAFDAVHRPLPADANAARLRLEGGNRAFAELLGRVTPSKPGRLSIDVDPHDVGLLHGRCAAPRQQPFAAVVGCADARVPVELIFSEGPNDLFVVRAAGNGMGDDVMGSLSYAVDHLKDSLRTIVVLGHSRCGAVSAAVDVHLEPAKYMKIIPQKDLRHIVDRTLVVVQLGATWLERVHGAEVIRRPGYRATLIEVAIVLNAALTAFGMRPTLNLAAGSEIEVVYGVYLLDERLVWAPRGEGSDWFGLAPAPSDPNDFVKLCDLLASCPRVEALLDIA